MRRTERASVSSTSPKNDDDEARDEEKESEREGSERGEAAEEE